MLSVASPASAFGENRRTSEVKPTMRMMYGFPGTAH
jgi:hypothetical protein